MSVNPFQPIIFSLCAKITNNLVEHGLTQLKHYTLTMLLTIVYITLRRWCRVGRIVLCMRAQYNTLACVRDVCVRVSSEIYVICARIKLKPRTEATQTADASRRADKFRAANN